VPAVERPVPASVPQHDRVDKGCQWIDFSLESHSYCRVGIPSAKKLVKEMGVQCGIADEETMAEKFIKTDTDAKLYTGVTKQVFSTIVDCMKPFAMKFRNSSSSFFHSFFLFRVLLLSFFFGER